MRSIVNIVCNIKYDYKTENTIPFKIRYVRIIVDFEFQNQQYQ